MTRKNRASQAIVIAWVGLSAAAFAQSSDSDQQLATVIVTAQKRPQAASEVPMSLTEATASQLTALGVTSTADLTKIVTDFSYTTSPYGAPIFTIRGIGYFDEAVGAAPTVSVYMDQVPLAFSRMTAGVGLDLERVEVLKGPQGTWFGQNSTGGAINYIAAKPAATFQSGALLTVGRFAEIDAEGFVSGPLADHLRARLAVRRETSDGWQQSTSRDSSLGARDFTNARFLLDYQPSDALLLEFSASGWIDRSQTQAGQFLAYSPTTPAQQGGFTSSPGAPDFAAHLEALPSAPPNDRAADWDPGVSLRRDDKFGAASLRADLRLNDRLTLTSISAFSRLRVLDPTDDDGTQYVNLRTLVDASISSFSQELRLAGEQSHTHWTIGANYEHDTIDDLQHFLNEGTNSGLFAGTPLEVRFSSGRNLNDQELGAGAVFGGVDYGVTDSLTLQGSARFTDTHRVFDGCLLDGGDGVVARDWGLLSNVLNGVNSFASPGDPGYVPPGGCITFDPDTNRPLQDVHQSTTERNVSWRAGAAWTAARAVLLYANATQGFKSGNFGTLVLLSPAQAAPVPAERLLAYEAGFKARIGPGFELEGAAFYYDYRNKQLLGYINTGQVFGNLPGEVSVPKSRVIGGELSLTARPLPGLSTSLGLSHLDSKVTSDYFVSRPISTTPPTANINGESFPFTPTWSVIGIVDYTHALTSHWNGFVGGNIQARGPTSSTFAPTDSFHIAGYALLDLRAGIARSDDSLRVEFWGHNVTDRYYWTDVARIQDTIFRITGSPATFGITLTARF